MNYSSGAPWYNANGDIVGITTAGTIGTGQGFTTSVRLFTPEIQAYLQPIIQDSWARYEASRCAADFNRDGQLNPDDLADYIGAFFSAPPGTGSDFNGDSVTDPDDLADFIGAFFAGCG